MGSPGNRTECATDGVETGFPADAPLALLSGVNAGLALFDTDLNLNFANKRYFELCAYSREEAHYGSNLKDLARVSMMKAGFDTDVVDDQIERSMRRLRSVGGFSFRFLTHSGDTIYVHRQMLPDGRVCEMVQETLPGVEDPAVAPLDIMVEAARTRMSHALDSMADGFALFDAED